MSFLYRAGKRNSPIFNKTSFYFVLYTLAILTILEIKNKLFNSFEFIAAITVVSLLIGLLIYQRKEPAKFYYEGHDNRHILRRQSPLVYAAIGVILSGLTSLNFVVGEPFVVTGHVEDKHYGTRKGGVVHMLDIRHERYGVLHYRASEKLWLSQEKGFPLLLKIQKNVFGLHVIIGVKPSTLKRYNKY